MLSSAAFSLGHGGADSQKVMGIMCAVCIVFADRNGEIEGGAKPLRFWRITDCLPKRRWQNKKYKPKIGTIENITFYEDGDEIIDLKLKKWFLRTKRSIIIIQMSIIGTDYDKLDDALEKLQCTRRVILLFMKLPTN